MRQMADRPMASSSPPARASSVEAASATSTEPVPRHPTCKVYRDGKAVPGVTHLSQISEVLKEEGCLVWLDVVDPAPNDLELLQAEFNLHPLAVEDAVHAHERPKIEAYGDYWF